MLDRVHDSPLDPERRREAAQIGRKALGPGLHRLFDEVLAAPAPEEWLELLRHADERERTTRT